MKFVYNFLIVFLLPLSCFSQFSITGRILNQADTRPVANASVFLADATIGANTADDGTFALKNVKPGKYNLVVSIIGFERYSQAITVNGNITLPDVLVFPKPISLNEVKIKPRDDSGREHYLGLFKSYFLGTSDLAKECTITNPEILDLDFDDATGTLTASTSDFLAIENGALGYKVQYQLTSFEVNTKENTISYKGYAFFSEIKGKASQEKYWKKNREQVYENSVPHFLRSSLNDQIEGEGFQVLKIANIANPERPSDAIIAGKISEFKTLNKRDSLSYWTKKSKLPATVQKLMPSPLSKTDIIKSTGQKGIYALECSNCALFVAYNKNHRFRANWQPEHLDDPKNKETTLVIFNTNNSALFDSNGRLLDPNSVQLSGAWANNRIAELLPLDYEGPKTIIASSADSAIITNVTGKLDAFAAGHIIEKAYLHLDKPAYLIGDTLWYKAYIVTGGQHKLSALSGVLYVELIGPADTVIKRQTLRLTEGVAWGDMDIPLKMKPGKYHLRAYTNWMRNAGPAYFFNEMIHIGGYEAPAPVKQTAQVNPDVQFLPEGGELVNGLRSKIAVKAVNQNGLGQDIIGTLVDNDDNVIVDFATGHLGMGVFAFTPQSGKTYKAQIKTGLGEPAFDVNLPKAKEAGFILGINNSRPDSIFLKVAANKILFQQKQHSAFYVIGQSAGKVYYTAKSTLEDQVFTSVIDKKRFPSGIVQFTLFSGDGEPLNERAAFIQNDDTLQLKINNPVKTLAPGQKVKLNLEIKNQSGQPVLGVFSAAVTNESLLPGAEPADFNIFSSLLLTSELKGYVEQPGYYFTNPNNQTRADLDVLLLTQGYQRFAWKPILNNTAPQFTYHPETSLELTGSIGTYSGKPVPNAKISLIALKDSFITDTVTDADGNFKFKNLDLPDSAKVVLSAKKINNNNNVNITIKKTDYPEVIKDNIAENNATADYTVTTIPDSIKKHLQQVADLRSRQMLKEVTIKAHAVVKRAEPDLTYSTNLNGPGHADQIIMSDDLTGCVTLSDCLTFTLRSGISIKNGKAINPHIHGMHQSPVMAVSIDGAISNNINLDDIDPNIVHSVEVLSSVATYSVYGYDIGGGVLVITTKHGAKDYATTAQAPGTNTYAFHGFYKAHEFYSPKYDIPRSNALASDMRGTIYWNPNIVTGTDGKTTLNYYNGGTKGIYRVVIEGINNDGDLGRLVYRYNVE